MPDHLKREVEEAAALVGSTLTAFATQTLVERAREIKHDYGTTVLEGQARESFIELMAGNPIPSEALRQTLNPRPVKI